MYLGDFDAGDTIYFKFTTVNTSGVPTALSDGYIAAYKDGSTTETLTGVTLTASFDSRTGLNHIAVDTSQDGTFYANGSDFQLVVITGSVGGNSIIGYEVGAFSLRNRANLYPTTAGRTLDVSAGGEAGLDWANIGSPTTAQNLSATNIDVDQVVASVSGNVGGSVGSVAAGGITAASIATDAIDADALAANAVAEIQSGLSTLDAAGVRTAVGLAAANLDTQLAALPTAAENADAVWDEALAGHLGAGSTGEALNAAGAAGDPWTTALPGAYGAGSAGNIIGNNLDAAVSSRASQTSLDTLDDFVDTEVAAIKAKTDQLTFTTANKVDATIQAAGDFAQAAADKVWLTASRTLTAFGFSVTVGTNNDKTGYTLSAAGVQAVWDALTSALTTVGSVGKLLVDNVNATISSRSSHSAADVWAVATRILTAGTNIVLAKGTGITGFNDLSAAQVNAEVVDALAVDTYAEPGQGAPAATATLAAKVGYLYKAFRNRKTQDATTLKLYADDGTTVDQKATISDDGTVYDHGEIGTGP